LLNGQTDDSLFVNSIDISANGFYYCVITYNNGQVVTDTAQVLIRNNPPTPVITQIGDYFYSNLGPQYQHQWYLNGQPIAGATDTFHLATATGSYSLQIDSSGCNSEFSNSIFYTIVSTSGITVSNFKIYPNPFNNILQIEHAAQIENFSILDIHGKTILESKNNGKENIMLDLHHLEAAFYYIKLIDKDGSIFNYSIIKSN
jgi:hypothetical protein